VDAAPGVASTNQDEGEVAFLRQQLEALQTRLNQRRDQQAAHQAKMTTLMRKSQQQQPEIETLKAQVDELRQAAAIGQSQLSAYPETANKPSGKSPKALIYRRVGTAHQHYI
jgi:chromosome segregation ATPase